MVDAADSKSVSCQFESDIRYARVAQRKRHSTKDADSVGSNPTLCTNGSTCHYNMCMYSNGRETALRMQIVQVRILSYTAPIAQMAEASDLSSEE